MHPAVISCKSVDWIYFFPHATFKEPNICHEIYIHEEFKLNLWLACIVQGLLNFYLIS